MANPTLTYSFWPKGSINAGCKNIECSLWFEFDKFSKIKRFNNIEVTSPIQAK
jgi:hypothetical protein